MQNRTHLVHGWVSDGCGRQTTDILWSCLVTIFLCVWTAIHLPVPHYTGKWPHSLRDRIIRSKAVPALFSVIAPEFLTVTAVVEYFGARTTTRYLRRIGFRDVSLVHGFYLYMGGFCLQSRQQYYQVSISDVKEIIERSSTQLQSAPSHPAGNGFSIGSGIGRDRAVTNTSGSVVAPPSDYLVTNSRTPEYPDWLLELTKTTEDQINDSASSDVLTKFIACVQASWFGAQVISRMCQHRTITLLEVSTAAYVFCAIVAYAAWWKKPHGCNVPILISCAEESMPTGVYSWYSHALHSKVKYFWGGARWLHDNQGIELWLILISTTLYGAIHVASWDVSLPSDPELWMWRASALYCSLPGILAALIVGFNTHPLPLTLETILWALVFLLIAVVRLYMLVEVFISLRALPQSAYESVQWLNFIPHI